MRGREQESLQRQVALVSYGGGFLRKALALEDWYRHEIFSGARQQFRDRAGNALLADDFTLWLATLARAGATHLSLHPVAVLGIDAAQELDRGRHVVAVHYPDRYQLWAAGEERAVWRTGGPRVPDAANYAGDVDCYLYLGERPGKLDVPHTDWKKLAAAIADDLETPVPSGEVPAASPQMPLFVATGADSLAHRVLATLVRKQGQFAYDTNPKNENGFYQHTDEAGAAAMQHWGERLDSWIDEVLLRAANIGSGTSTQHGEERLASPPPPPAPLSLAPVAEAPPAGEGKWTRRISLAIAIAVLSLLVLAFAHIIARFPWLAVLIGMPLVLMRQKR